jgi:hypothetical protein
VWTARFVPGVGEKEFRSGAVAVVCPACLRGPSTHALRYCAAWNPAKIGGARGGFMKVNAHDRFRFIEQFPRFFEEA